MKEIYVLRISYDYAHLLFRPDEGRNDGTSVRVVEITKDDPRYHQIPIVARQVKEKFDRGFLFCWHIKRKYSKSEFEMASLFHMKIKTTFEPAGEECGTIYDESVACDICGANRKQLGPLRLKKGSLPKKDIAGTIAGEVIASSKFSEAFNRYNLRGAVFAPLLVEKGNSDYYQLIATSPELALSCKTITGDDPFESSDGSDGGEYYIAGSKFTHIKEIYRCPTGHLIGLNIISEPIVLYTSAIHTYDLFVSEQKIGVKRGLLRPEPIYLCSQAFRNMVLNERLSGFDFEVARIEK